jgi:4-hydroxy-2-oxoheptanedioate aldolase
MRRPSFEKNKIEAYETKLEFNPFTQALRDRQKQVGLWVSLSNNFAAEVISTAGFDWVLLDMEHSPNELNSLLGQLQTFASSSTTAIVRPDWNDPVKVKRLLDLGAEGPLFPMIQSVAEAESAVSASRYPPRGIRGVSTSTRAEQIAAFDGVSAVFFGPADIAADIGLLGKPGNSEVWDLIWPVAEKLIQQGVAVGTLVFDPKFAAELFNRGFTFVACGSDTSLLARGADDLLATVKKPNLVSLLKILRGYIYEKNSTYWCCWSTRFLSKRAFD